MLQVSELYFYPIKSLAGISVTFAQLTDRGFEYDRRWMLVDRNNRFLTQRELHTMALLQPEVVPTGIMVYPKNNSSDHIIIPFIPPTTKPVVVDVWQNICEALWVDESFDNWFSEKLGIPCRLMYMADDTIIRVQEKYSIDSALTSFSDGFPILMVSRESLEYLNSRMNEILPVNRFRPNLVFTGGHPFIEDTMAEFEINGYNFYGVKPSARCMITTIDQETIEKGKEPLKTLSEFRKLNTNVYFGENVIAANSGRIHVGDTITITKIKEGLFANSPL